MPIIAAVKVPGVAMVQLFQPVSGPPSSPSFTAVWLHSTCDKLGWPLQLHGGGQNKHPCLHLKGQLNMSDFGNCQGQPGQLRTGQLSFWLRLTEVFFAKFSNVLKKSPMTETSATSLTMMLSPPGSWDKFLTKCWLQGGFVTSFWHGYGLKTIGIHCVSLASLKLLNSFGRSSARRPKSAIACVDETCRQYKIIQDKDGEGISCQCQFSVTPAFILSWFAL